MLDFVTQAHTALEKLHNLGNAHTDVRLPNFCFSKDHQLKLIDFDRAIPVNSPYHNNKDYFFYQCPEEGPTGHHLDYKQLGLIIIKVLNYNYGNNNWKLLKKIHDLHDFISCLINHGEFDQSHFEAWKDNLADRHKKSLTDVLTSRTAKS